MSKAKREGSTGVLKRCKQLQSWRLLSILFIALIAWFHPRPAEAQVAFTQITTSERPLYSSTYNGKPSINADGSRIAFMSQFDLTGGNSDHNWEIFLWTADSGLTQITNSIGGWADGSYFPSINADGTRIAFVSDRNLIGGNPDTSREIFLWTADSGLTQITNTIGEVVDGRSPSINADGTRIAFVSNFDQTGSNLGKRDLFLWTSGSGVTRITNSSGGGLTGPMNDFPSINADGTRIAFWAWGDPTGSDNGGATWRSSCGQMARVSPPSPAATRLATFPPSTQTVPGSLLSPNPT